MKNQTLNLFIVDDNPVVAKGLQYYLDTRFGNNLNISSFTTGESALQKLDQSTNIVILDYFLDGEDGKEILKSIKSINPNVEVIMHSSNDDIGVAIDLFRNGASDYVLKGEKSWKKLTSILYKTLTYPVRIMVQEFGINKYLAMFLITFLAMGIGVVISLNFSRWFSNNV